jgi:sugar/nucleoside kinase (ribokinase family)
VDGAGDHGAGDHGERQREAPVRGASPRALFAGLCTLDIIQGVTRMPGRNEKVTAQRQTIAAGGPATNAAVTFAFLGGRATLLTGVGGHPLTRGMLADLEDSGVTLVDVTAGDNAPPAVSSIIVTQGSGDRCVVSTNAADRRLQPPPALDDLVTEASVVLIDGHHPALALATARTARARGRLTVLDGGSWKPGTPGLLPYVDIAICSADFRPPGSDEEVDVLGALLDAGVSWAAVTHGPRPVRWAGRGARGEVPVPSVDAADTLGAGDVFHGAFTYAVAALGADAEPFNRASPGSGSLGPSSLGPSSLGSALGFAASVAAHSCRTFGTRTWTTSWPPDVP